MRVAAQGRTRPFHEKMFEIEDIHASNFKKDFSENRLRLAAACAAVWNGVPRLMANPWVCPSDCSCTRCATLLPKDYEGTLRQLGAMGYREVEAAGFFGHTPSEVKQAMDQAGLNCVSAHYPLKDLLAEGGRNHSVRQGSGTQVHRLRVADAEGSVARERIRVARGQGAMTLDDWRWNADQFNHIGERVNAAGMRFAYHNHTPSSARKTAFVFYDELLRLTDPAKVTMEMDCGWAVIGGQNPANYLTRYPTRISMLHVKDFKMTPADTPANAPPSTELGRGTIDYHPIFEAAKKAASNTFCGAGRVRHARRWKR
jgi:sugar phosphate isomerase/epimerase